MGLTRRGFLGSAAVAAAGLATPALAQGARPRIVVVGGGAAGASVARHLGDSGAAEVTLLEPTKAYYTCFFSNHYLGGLLPFDDLAHTYGALASRHGVTVIHDWAAAIDRDAANVRLGSGATLPWDRLVLAPGIGFVEGAVPGWSLADQDVMPHAYIAGSQTELLKAQIGAMRPGGTFCLIAPPNPYRCPPAPYERASMVAHVLKETNPTAKILILDPKETFSKMALFQEGWSSHYPGMIERIGPEFGGGDIEVRPESMEVVVDGEVQSVDVCNVIPAQRAGELCHAAGLTEGDWAPVEPLAMRSTIDPRIHVVGDSSDQGEMPKSASAANSQAGNVAAAILADLAGTPTPRPAYTNTCWSLIAENDAVKVGGSYAPERGRLVLQGGGFISEVGEPADLRESTFLESVAWYEGITGDMFGTD